MDGARDTRTVRAAAFAAAGMVTSPLYLAGRDQ